MESSQQLNQDSGEKKVNVEPYIYEGCNHTPNQTNRKTITCPGCEIFMCCLEWFILDLGCKCQYCPANWYVPPRISRATRLEESKSDLLGDRSNSNYKYSQSVSTSANTAPKAQW